MAVAAAAVTTPRLAGRQTPRRPRRTRTVARGGACVFFRGTARVIREFSNLSRRVARATRMHRRRRATTTGTVHTLHPSSRPCKIDECVSAFFFYYFRFPLLRPYCSCRAQNNKTLYYIGIVLKVKFFPPVYHYANNAPPRLRVGRPYYIRIN